MANLRSLPIERGNSHCNSVSEYRLVNDRHELYRRRPFGDEWFRSDWSDGNGKRIFRCADSLVTTRNNSWVFGVGNDFDNAIARTPGSGQSLVHQFLAPIGDTYWVQMQNAPLLQVVRLSQSMTQHPQPIGTT
jgi:hypothetical protein